MNNEIYVEEKLDFNWNVYKNGYVGSVKLIQNQDIIGNNNFQKCFSRESYAQELFDLFTNQNYKVIKKDLQEGEYIQITNIIDIRDTVITVELLGGLQIDIDLNREKNLVKIFGYNTPRELIEILNNEGMIDKFLENNLTAYIIETFPNIKVSLWQGYINSTKKEFMMQIKNPTKAYKSKIINCNKGGFFVEVQGINAFMPGSLAAPNKIIDFQSYLGKEIIVMVEDFLVEMNSFIFSHKKYLEHIMPQKIKELDLAKQYEGSITGIAKFGIFIEWNGFFTGLLHISKMSEKTKELFNKFLYNPGDKINFYISEIGKDNRIILSEENPNDKLIKIQNFILENKDKILEVNVIAAMKYGLFINIEEGIIGMIPLKEFRKYKINIENYNVGDIINVLFDEYNEDKLFFKFPNKK